MLGTVAQGAYVGDATRDGKREHEAVEHGRGAHLDREHDDVDGKVGAHPEALGFAHEVPDFLQGKRRDRGVLGPMEDDLERDGPPRFDPR